MLMDDFQLQMSIWNSQKDPKLKILKIKYGSLFTYFLLLKSENQKRHIILIFHVPLYVPESYILPPKYLPNLLHPLGLLPSLQALTFLLEDIK